MLEQDAIKNSYYHWNKIHKFYSKDKIKYDNWLNPFKEIILNCKTPIIDLGCGLGNNTLFLTENEKEVIPCDYSENALKNIHKNFPTITKTECFDMTNGLPFDDNFTNIIIADLSIHYFSEKLTFEILKEIKRVLTPDGFLFFRVNSTNDVNYHSTKGVEVQHHLYEYNDMYKRFFDKKDLEHFFSNWKIVLLSEEKMLRYSKEKIVWLGAVKPVK